MSDIRHILLLPADGDPLGLLAEGPCGATPPYAVEMADGTWQPGDWHTIHEACALVLAWEGEVVPEGCDRLDRSWSTVDTEGWVSAVLQGHAPPVIAPHCGTLLCLDANFREVMP